MICPKCPAEGFSSESQLAAHFVEHHTMSLRESRRLATESWRKGGLGTPSAPPSHVCECGRSVACAFQTASLLKSQAASLRMIAAKLEEREAGTLNHYKRKNREWTTEEAIRLVTLENMSYSAVGRLLNADRETIKRAVNGNGHAK